MNFLIKEQVSACWNMLMMALVVTVTLLLMSSQEEAEAGCVSVCVTVQDVIFLADSGEGLHSYFNRRSAFTAFILTC